MDTITVILRRTRDEKAGEAFRGDKIPPALRCIHPAPSVDTARSVHTPSTYSYMPGCLLGRVVLQGRYCPGHGRAGSPANARDPQEALHSACQMLRRISNEVVSVGIACIDRTIAQHVIAGSSCRDSHGSHRIGLVPSRPRSLQRQLCYQNVCLLFGRGGMTPRTRCHLGCILPRGNHG